MRRLAVRAAGLAVPVAEPLPRVAPQLAARRPEPGAVPRLERLAAVRAAVGGQRSR